MKTIAMTGLSGVVGQQLFSANTKLFSDYTLIDLYHHKRSIHSKLAACKLDLLETEQIFTTLSKLRPDIVIHLAAATHLDRCQGDKLLGKAGDVWKLNVDATRAICRYCQEYGKKLIFLSSECVFDGHQTSYQELDPPTPKSWYGVTKAVAEALLIPNPADISIVRGVVAYDIHGENTQTIFGRFKKLLQNNQPIKAVSDQLFTPTYIPDLWKTIDLIIQTEMKGIFHVAQRKPMTPYDFAVAIVTYFNWDVNLVKKTTLAELFGKTRAELRLKNACLDTKWTEETLGVRFQSLQKAMKLIKT
ncbi:MAG: hypothetical protein COY81_00205 [Candidatus Pacebacteria bacterium CG_4_10_14_0_8_um_filter_43_12]|nr:MAG: hypothetical protein COY81_00205 [Candidatus Pacebacteria bacterium CG_4_10_14_0_8_um_filter_43_12]